MPRLEVRKHLFDILQACDLLVEFTAGKTLADYSTDALLRSGVERQFGIIGEAVSQALAEVMHRSPKNLMRMLGPQGNPQAQNLFAIVAYLLGRERIQFELHAVGA